MALDPFCEAVGDIVDGQRLVCDKLRPHSGQHYDIAMQRFFDTPTTHTDRSTTP